VNTGSQAVARAVAVALGAVMMIVLTRYLGVRSFGVLVAATAYVSIFSVVVDLGTGTILLRELAAHPGSASRLLPRILGLRIALAALAGLVATALLPLVYPAAHDRQMRIAVLIVLPTVLFASITSTLVAPLQAQLRMRSIAAVDIAVQVLATTLVLLLVHWHRSLYVLLAVGVAVAAVNLAIVALVCRSDGLFAPRVDTVEWRRVLSASLPLGVALLLNTIYFRIDALLLSVLRGPGATGVYGVSYRFLEASTGFTNLLVLSFFPLLAAAAGAGNMQRLRHLATRGLDAIVLLVVPVVAATVVMAPELVRLAAGSAFASAVGPLRVLIVASALMPVNGLLGYMLIALHRERDCLWLNVLALVLNVGLNVALIPRYGVTAAAWVCTGSEVVILAGALWLARRYAGFRLSTDVPARALCAGAFMFFAMWFTDAELAVATVVGVSAYALALYLLRVHRVLPLGGLLVRAER
jgi:O-antigen/teichoic acid export membrane protein